MAQHTSPPAYTATFHTTVCLIAALVPGLQTYALLHRTGTWDRSAELHLGSALALMLLAFLIRPGRTVAWRAAAVGIALADVAFQWLAASDYTVPSMLQPAYILSLWGIVAGIRLLSPTHTHAGRAVALATPLLVVWGAGAIWSPLVTITAENYGGGERLLTLGITSLVALVLSVVLTVQHWQRTDGDPAVWIGAMGLFAGQQAALSGELRFIPLCVLTALALAGVTRWLGARRLLTGSLTALLLGGGYLLTLRWTSLLAWNITVWFGALVLCTLLALATAAFTATPSEVTA